MVGADGCEFGLHGLDWELTSILCQSSWTKEGAMQSRNVRVRRCPGTAAAAGLLTRADGWQPAEHG